MRADKDFKTYEQALSAVQRFGELAEADHKKGRNKEAQYNLAHATFVGVKHLMFMAADAAIDRAEARDLASKNHLATIELMSLTLAALKGSDAETGVDAGSADGQDTAGAVRSARAGRKTVKTARKSPQVARGGSGSAKASVSRERRR